jgi:hypothetical protein
VRDEKMLKKLATHDVQDVSELLNLVDKCVRAVEGCAWHSQPTPEARMASKPKADAAAQSSDKNKNKNKNKNRKKKKAGDSNKPLAGAPTAAAATGGVRGQRGDKQSRQPFDNNEGGLRCPIHNSRCHNVKKWWEIKKLAEQFCEQQK